MVVECRHVYNDKVLSGILSLLVNYCCEHTVPEYLIIIMCDNVECRIFTAVYWYCCTVILIPMTTEQYHDYCYNLYWLLDNASYAGPTS
jgi:hypothetical protein